jgi:hypothetical protein
MKYTKKHEAMWKVVADVFKTIGTSILIIALVGILIEGEKNNNNSITIYLLFFFAGPILIILSMFLTYISTIDTNEQVVEEVNDIKGRGG